MAKLQLLIDAWDEGHREFNIALEGLTDQDLWVRPHPKLLSIGELVGHVTYYESRMTTGHLSDDQQIKGTLVDPAFQYYTSEIDEPVVIDLSVEDLIKEANRVHAEAKQVIERLDPEATDPITGREGATWGPYLQYLAFHVAYHSGQIYTVRHLMGHTPPDN